jgi:outer membrane protein OmpA-like peptidoglycan-associated protein/Tfp pilus assembly protein PilF
MHLTKAKLHKRLRFTTQRGFTHSPLWCSSKSGSTFGKPRATEGLTHSKCTSSTLSRFLLHNLSLKLFFACLLVFSISGTSWSQKKYYTKSKKAIKYFESAFKNYQLQYFNNAKNDLEKSLSYDGQFIDAYILLGEIANEENNKEKAIEYYQKAISINKDYNPLMYLRKADLEKETGKYHIAKTNYETFLSSGKQLKEYRGYVEKKIRQCKFAIELKKKPVEFNPNNLGADINTSISEYWPSLTADGEMLVFTTSNRKTNSQEDLYSSIKINGQWQKAVKIAPPINTQGSEGAQTISADGKTMVFTACLRKDGYGSCDLYISKKKGANWSRPVNIGPPINSQYKESQPSLSANGETLFFASNRPGGKGQFDIWKSDFVKGKWTTPLNLGDSINTAEDELAPFIHYDNKTLYFSSQGHLGMGGSDLFISKKLENNTWSKAKNLGYPINTHYNEESLIVTADGKLGLFSSNMDGGLGQKDIYQFVLPTEIKPGKTIFIKGLVFNAKTKEPLAAKVEISNTNKNETLNTESDEITGEFLSCLPPQQNYFFHVEKEGFMIFSDNFALADSSIFIKIALQPIEIGSTAILKNIFFEYNSYQLKKESFPELEKLKKFILKNNLSVEIQGHTDNEGTDAYNQKLSTNRAKSVLEYLLKIGVKKEQLSYKGYGFKHPIASNQTEEGRAKNRRTEFKVISVK